MRRWWTPIALALVTMGVATGCYDHGYNSTGTTGILLNPPANLSYQLDPSGTPGQPAGILLRWDVETDPNLASYRVYSRPSPGTSFDLRGETSSNTFHDDGAPDYQYEVTAVSVDGTESNPSSVVTVNESLALESPATLGSIALDGMVHLQWADNAYASAPGAFSYYRIYSAGYNLDQNLCDTTWSIEGTTVAPTFLAGALTDGVPLCFAVSAISLEGYESAWSPITAATPRPDGANVIVFDVQDSVGRSGFRFWLDANGDGVVQRSELGIVGPGGGTAMDFSVSRDSTGLWLVPQRAGVQVTAYGNATIPDLAAISLAPDTGYAATAIQALPMWGYVFQIANPGAAYYQYGALRVSAVGTDYVIFDWAYQTDPGNPQLLREGK